MSRYASGLQEIERDMGALSNKLQCGEYEYRDVKSFLQEVQEAQSALSDLSSDTEDYLEQGSPSPGEECRMKEMLGWVDDALMPLGIAEEQLMDLAKDIRKAKYAVEAAVQLDAACDMLTRAMEAL